MMDSLYFEILAMTSILYDFVLVLAALMYLPKVIYQWMFKGKYRESILQRFGCDFPKIDKNGRTLIWIHAVSVGETKAVAPLVRKMKKEFHNPIIVISSTTETGHAEAIRSVACADYHVYLPLDFRWMVRPIVRRVKPDLVVLTETDFWYNFLRSAKKEGAHVVLVNGKLSAKSLNRFRFLRFFSSRLFAHVDRFCLQSQHYYERFIKLGIPKERIVITGNLKFDDEYPKLPAEELIKWKEELGIRPEDRVIVAGSTHEPEELLFLEVMQGLWKTFPDTKLVLVPRHPERFEAVAALLTQKDIPFCRFSGKKCHEKGVKAVLVDAMGLLRKCYQFADVAIVAGSYTSKVGGHNILEPCWYGVPVIFGPHMEQQPELVDLVKQYQAGMQVRPMDLQERIGGLLLNEKVRKEIGQSGLRLVAANQGATERTWQTISCEMKKTEAAQEILLQNNPMA